jgi:hypothetical protein
MLSLERQLNFAQVCLLPIPLEGRSHDHKGGWERMWFGAALGWAENSNCGRRENGKWGQLPSSAVDSDREGTSPGLRR